MLFLDDGVLQLAVGQAPQAVQQKDLTANLQALPMFGVESLYACAQSLALRGLSETSLDVERLDSAALRALIDRYDQVITL